VEASWSEDLSSNREALWPLLADTSSLNDRLGLPEMEFEERDGRLFGSSGKGFGRQEWVEVPWAWETGKSLTAERLYSRGFALAVRVRYILDDYEAGTRLTVDISWIPRAWWSRYLLIYINRWLRKQYRRVLLDLDGLAGNQIMEPLAKADVRVDEDRLQSGIRKLTESGFSAGESERLANYIRTATDQHLFRIRPKILAFEWGVELEDLLALLLQAVRSGLLRLSWDVMCPHCQGVRKESRSLGDLSEFGRCDICDINFDATALDSIEVTFKVLAEIRVVRKVFYCSAEPAKKPHIIVQHHLRPSETYETNLTLSPGRYRLRRAIGKNGSISFEVSKMQGDGSLTWITNDSTAGTPLSMGSSVTLKLVNPETERVSVVLERVAEDATALRPSELFNLQRFRDLFSEESIASGLKLEVGHQTLLFTDIVGSTQLYGNLGDTKAFNTVHAHFVALQDIIGSKRGAVVKTIGDAMMAAFQRPEDALEAAIEIQQKFEGNEEDALTLRISLHRGICLAVGLESNIDYFGNTVNYAARMQSVAGAREIVLSNEFFSQPGIPEKARRCGLNVEEVPFSLLSGEDYQADSVLLASFQFEH
jgi:class 3 adenylate cyclase